MRIRIFAGGKIARSPLAAAVEDYRRRIPWPTEINELSPIRKRASATLLSSISESKKSGHSVVCVLDARGRSCSSEELASFISDQIQHSINQILFIIGDADGLEGPVLDAADIKLSLGAMTWPHLLARLMLVEQIYRAAMILEGHPYHRA